MEKFYMVYLLNDPNYNHLLKDLEYNFNDITGYSNMLNLYLRSKTNDNLINYFPWDEFKHRLRMEEKITSIYFALMFNLVDMISDKMSSELVNDILGCENSSEGIKKVMVEEIERLFINQEPLDKSQIEFIDFCIKNDIYTHTQDEARILYDNIEVINLNSARINMNDLTSTVHSVLEKNKYYDIYSERDVLKLFTYSVNKKSKHMMTYQNWCRFKQIIDSTYQNNPNTCEYTINSEDIISDLVVHTNDIYQLYILDSLFANIIFFEKSETIDMNKSILAFFAQIESRRIETNYLIDLYSTINKFYNLIDPKLASLMYNTIITILTNKIDFNEGKITDLCCLLMLSLELNLTNEDYNKTSYLLFNIIIHQNLDLKDILSNLFSYYKKTRIEFKNESVNIIIKLVLAFNGKKVDYISPCFYYVKNILTIKSEIPIHNQFLQKFITCLDNIRNDIGTSDLGDELTGITQVLLTFLDCNLISNKLINNFLILMERLKDGKYNSNIQIDEITYRYRVNEVIKRLVEMKLINEKVGLELLINH
jgi:hypothetical protein